MSRRLEPSWNSGPGALLRGRVLEQLETRALGRTLLLLEEVTSTSDVARADAQDGTARDGYLVLAERQTAGRGRRGRSWVAPPGENLSFSLVLRPALAIEEAPSLTLAAAVGCRDALAALGAEAEIKWPNDLLIGGRKVAGILAEMGLAGGRFAFAVIGIGLNVNLDPTALPPPLCETATSLAQALGRQLDRSDVLACLVNHLEPAFDALACGGFAAIRSRYEAHSATLGRRVRVQLEGEALEGEAFALTARGALRLRLDSGEVREVLSGDVERLRGA